MNSLEPDADQLRALATAPDATPIVMLNLLRYRDRATYPGGGDDGLSGREAYARYGAVALAHVARAGGRVVYHGAVEGTFIGPHDDLWDDVLLVEYPSRAAFLRMIGDADYRDAARHRAAALERTRIFVTVG